MPLVRWRYVGTAVIRTYCPNEYARMACAKKLDFGVAARPSCVRQSSPTRSEDPNPQNVGSSYCAEAS